MHHLSSQTNHSSIKTLLSTILVLLVVTAAGMANAQAATLGDRYPELAAGLLKSAELAALDKETLLTADGIIILKSELLASIRGQDPKLRSQLEKNMLYVLEQEAVRRVLLNEARKAGIASDGGDDNRTIQAFFEHKTKDLSVSEEEAHAFYEANKEMIGGKSYEEVAHGIGPYLLEEKKQEAIQTFIDTLGTIVPMRIDAKWVEAQHQLALDNPVDKARHSGKPTMIEFGATGCVPCDMMQPILDSLRKDYPEKLNVVFVHVGQEQVLAARYGIRSIPVQVFFDDRGKEVFRHVGFFAQADVSRQLNQMGVRK